MLKPQETQENQVSSPYQLDLIKKARKVKPKKQAKINQLPEDNLLNLAFNKDSNKNIHLPSIKSVSPKETSAITSKEKHKTEIELKEIISLPLIIGNNSNNNIIQDIGNKTPAVEEDNENVSSNSFYKNKPISNNVDDEDNEGSNYYVQKEEIFDNNNLFNDDDSPEIKPFEDDENMINKQNLNVYENKTHLEMIINHKNYLLENNRDMVNNAEQLMDIEMKDCDNENKLQEDNNVIVDNNKVVIPLNAFMNLNNNTFLNQFNEDSNMLREEKDNVVLNTSSKIKQKNKIVDDDYLDKQYEDNDEVKYDNEKKNNEMENNKANKDSPLVKVEGTKIKLPLKLDSLKGFSKREKNKMNNKITPTSHSYRKHKERKMSTGSNKLLQSKHHSTNTNHVSSNNTIRNKNYSVKNNNNSQLMTNNNDSLKTMANHQLLDEFNQEPPLIHEIKKKEYDIVCISMLESLLNKMKTKHNNATNESSSSSSFTKSFDDINKILTQLNTSDPSKRVKHITEKSMKILSILFDLLENEKKRESYLYDILQIIDVIQTFQHKTKINYGQKIPQWFKLIKLCFKYISSLFRIKSYSMNQIKELINQNDSDNKVR